MLHRVMLRGGIPLRQPCIGSACSESLTKARSSYLHRPAFIGSLLSDQSAGTLAGQRPVIALSGLQKRCYSAAKSPEGDEVQDAAALKKEQSILRRYYGAGTFATGGIIAYGAWWGISSSMKMIGAVYASPHIVAYVGFWAGIGTATMCAALATALYRLTFIRPEFAFRDTLEIVKNNDTVKSTLGETIGDGKVKTYEIKGGRFTVTGGSPTWVPHKLQMMYIIYGEKGMGLVTTVCNKKPSLIPRALTPNLLAVDFMDKDNKKTRETLVIVGDKSQLEVRDNIYRLLDMKLDFAASAQK